MAPVMPAKTLQQSEGFTIHFLQKKKTKIQKTKPKTKNKTKMDFELAFWCALPGSQWVTEIYTHFGFKTTSTPQKGWKQPVLSGAAVTVAVFATLVTHTLMDLSSPNA